MINRWRGKRFGHLSLFSVNTARERGTAYSECERDAKSERTEKKGNSKLKRNRELAMKELRSYDDIKNSNSIKIVR